MGGAFRSWPVDSHRQLGSEDWPLAVGLEAVQQRFQPALDDYLAGRLDEAGLVAATEWERRWYWSFAAYAPIFRICRTHGVTMLALDMDSEDKAKVELGGALEPAKRRQYVPDGDGFERFGSTRAFEEYNGAANDVLLAELKGLKDSFDAEQIDEDQFKMLRSECVKKHAAIGRALMEQAKRSARGGGPRRAAQMEEDDSGRFLNTFTWGPYGMAVHGMPDATISEGAAMMRSTLCHSKNLNPTIPLLPAGWVIDKSVNGKPGGQGVIGQGRTLPLPHPCQCETL
ncbi:hypothetical protein EMIHUDRAFT_249275 [Emiliania huxleyi CCMP1516]|uniref:Haem-binding uptake Tiki superfamily ChaN domain-containing protein n=2 Tax=Emiliania huxleyi TaxID=2903 RepID=A0A0D3I9F4_EMIH1|nr:hypothetical protein EMIHUDRAFT_249275 [Emiliania huxleyi CCMP1516]EOD07889.1 hypothetical protein EMIHUDRAFT_249275 [Emiliania huxleyi CCMP1516]|eukprot:XP_005760318.1 hypothetical protein EMIHUDRAFT_249275 [Emiliania huxleyi CCMP1516]